MPSGCGRALIIPRELHVEGSELKITPIPETAVLRNPDTHIRGPVGTASTTAPIANGSRVEVRLNCSLGERHTSWLSPHGKVGVRVLATPDGSAYTEIGCVYKNVPQSDSDTRIFTSSLDPFVLASIQKHHRVVCLVVYTCSFCKSPVRVLRARSISYTQPFALADTTLTFKPFTLTTASAVRAATRLFSVLLSPRQRSRIRLKWRSLLMGVRGHYLATCVSLSLFLSLSLSLSL